MDLQKLNKYFRRIKRALKVKKIAGKTKQIGTFAATHKRETAFLLNEGKKLIKKGAAYGRNKGIPGFKTK